VGLVAVEEGSGCLAAFLLIATAFVMVVEGIKVAVVRLAPYWPLVCSQLKFWAVVGLVVFATYRCRCLVTAIFDRWDKRLEVEAQEREAKAEMRAIQHDAARQMERVRRQAGQ
jgi:hypothetical protein